MYTYSCWALEKIRRFCRDNIITECPWNHGTHCSVTKACVGKGTHDNSVSCNAMSECFCNEAVDVQA
jgi:hypothetical protein